MYIPNPFQYIQNRFIMDDEMFEEAANVSPKRTTFRLALLSGRYNLVLELYVCNKHLLRELDCVKALDLKDIRLLYDHMENFPGNIPQLILDHIISKVKDKRDLVFVPECKDKRFLEMAMEGQWPESQEDLLAVGKIVLGRKHFPECVEYLKRIPPDVDLMMWISMEFPDELVPTEVFAKLPREDLMHLLCNLECHAGVFAHLAKTIDMNELVSISPLKTTRIAYEYMGEKAFEVSRDIRLIGPRDLLWAWEMGLIRKVLADENTFPPTLEEGVLKYKLESMWTLGGSHDQLDFFMMLFYMTDHEVLRHVPM